MLNRTPEEQSWSIPTEFWDWFWIVVGVAGVVGGAWLGVFLADFVRGM